MAIVGLIVLALDSIGGNTVDRHQRRRNIVLSAQGVAGTQSDGGTAVPQRHGQVGRLTGHVKAGGDAQTLQRPLLDEPVTDQPQHRHLLGGPLNPKVPLLGQGDVLDISFRICGLP